MLLRAGYRAEHLLGLQSCSYVMLPFISSKLHACDSDLCNEQFFNHSLHLNVPPGTAAASGVPGWAGRGFSPSRWSELASNWGSDWVREGVSPPGALDLGPILDPCRLRVGRVQG